MSSDYDKQMSASAKLMKSMYGDAIAKSLVNDIAVLKMLSHDDYERAHHTVTRPHPEKWLSARQAFYERWQKMTDEGLEYGYLDYQHCYECGGELMRDQTTGVSETVYDETEEEWQERIAKLPPRAAFTLYQIDRHVEQHRKALDE